MKTFILWFLKQVSPNIRELLIHGVLELDKLAKTTENDFDDQLVELLKNLLDIKE